MQKALEPSLFENRPKSVGNTKKGEETMIACKHDHTHLTSEDPKKLIEFYTKVLGASIKKEKEISGRKITDLNLGGVTIRITNGTSGDSNWKGLRLGLHHLGLTVQDLGKAAAEMKSQGVEFVVNPTSEGPNVKYAFIKAPGGVLIEISEEK